MASKNVGKQFEAAIKQAIPSYCLTIRIPDPPQSFKQSDALRFSPRNPCDYIVYDSNDGKLWCLELKTTSGTSMGFENIDGSDKTKRMIKAHQTKSLLEFSRFNGVVAGFLFNFRHFEGEPNYIETTYFMEVNRFQSMCNKLNKKSFTEADAILNGAIKIRGIKKRSRFTWDIESLFKNYNS